MRGATAIVLLAEIVNYVLLELALQVHDVMGHTNLLADPPSIVDVLYRAAPPRRGRNIATLLSPQPHGHAHDIVALLFQQQRRHG
jgi:hypothetical protein